MPFALYGCFTGVEGTKAITQKDVAKAYDNDNVSSNNDMSIYKIKPAKFSEWEKGKIFYVTDDNIKLLFSPQGSTDNEASLNGQMLTYRGYTTNQSIDGKEVINIQFEDKNHLQYTLPTNKTLSDIDQSDSGYSIPFLVDMDEVLQLRSMLEGKELYIKTSIWYNSEGKMIHGRKFVKVRITDIKPGNKYFPYMLKFVDNDSTAYLFLTEDNSTGQNRSLADLFSTTDIHNRYPSISDENWQQIIDSNLTIDMTKDECRLSIGAPKNIERVPTYNGLQEYWTYDNGAYLIFQDGRLIKYRK